MLIHSNVKLPWGWLRYIIVTPDFHHWHHSSDNEAIDRNYAAHLSFIDYLFGTAVRRREPAPAGELDNDMPGTFLAQAYPFRRNRPGRAWMRAQNPAPRCSRHVLRLGVAFDQQLVGGKDPV